MTICALRFAALGGMIIYLLQESRSHCIFVLYMFVLLHLHVYTSHRFHYHRCLSSLRMLTSDIVTAPVQPRRHARSYKNGISLRHLNLDYVHMSCILWGRSHDASKRAPGHLTLSDSVSLWHPLFSIATHRSPLERLTARPSLRVCPI